ncbi:ABC transporter ATP-binding protein [Rhodoferax sediminis]|uniref:ABC transporter ATP-binding protein n=1 Tax=Rhodoferax sediminis TaxID=2509614 RepID=A0A515DCB1_9BURK|nr:ABC transporter ATP-binding protein [Rhodoferax sediminis]QDL38042.1 ABC transporter ATP-binding protein [Rhodoferax sediminis]
MLQVRHLVKYFSGVKAVDGVSFEVRAGECVALIGPNGAGKSTCFACIAGQQRPSGGEILWAGQRIDALAPARRLARGVARTFQVAQTFDALTVLQNLQLLMTARHGLPAWNVLDRVSVAAATQLLARVGLQHLAHADALGLPYGAKKRLELAMALVGLGEGEGALADPQGRLPSPVRPRLLLLDEPGAGLAETERLELMQLVKSLARDGVAVLYTEHNMDAVFGVADRVLVLIEGRLAAQGTPDEIARHPEVRSRYLGHSFDATRRAPSHA